ncbi:BON domain-containing protein [Chitinophagaceae bacterium LB-8]|uniref:BON domain-containing protein n=1 Tax=Paraflavisolibacter caeni TaxID=2982496 RepID=A0A9X2XNK8_9BACT|nr:BON domain-containing protein [Paraflavisolibacter caeni]MCU7549013.1 BON domain-containing protein [Paraflavisolibacter caeni]
MADKNRDQWSNPYGQDWDQNENRYNRYQDDQRRNRNYGNANYDRDDDQRRRDYGNFNQGYGNDYQDDYNRGKYGTSGNQNQGYGSRYGTSGGYGNREGDWDLRGYDQGRRNRENDWDYNQRTSFGEQGYYGGNYEKSNYARGDYGRNRDYDRNRGRENVREDRSWWDKTTDEVSSWFGDDAAERRREGDKQFAGQHRGKGPKGYSRSDERIREDVSDRLSDDDYVDASDIDVQVTSGEVILLGTVDSRDAKRRAEDIAEHISGVRNVENRLHVGTERLSVGSSTVNVSNTNRNRNTNV